MRVYLDDRRPAPKDWILAESAQKAISLLQTGEVEEISLDHDLGDLLHDPEETGYTVLAWIEEKCALDPKYIPPIIHVHTANVAVREKMEKGVESIVRMVHERMVGIQDAPE